MNILTISIKYMKNYYIILFDILSTKNKRNKNNITFVKVYFSKKTYKLIIKVD